jgi:hypothetical protein
LGFSNIPDSLSILTRKSGLKGRFFAIAQNDNRLPVILNGAKLRYESRRKTKESGAKELSTSELGINGV